MLRTISLNDKNWNNLTLIFDKMTYFSVSWSRINFFLVDKDHLRVDLDSKEEALNVYNGILKSIVKWSEEDFRSSTCK